jgi:hypothetical protein
MVVVAPFSDAEGHAKRKNRERWVEIRTISQTFETHKESLACIGTLVGRQDMRAFAVVEVVAFCPERNALKSTLARTSISQRNGCADLTVLMFFRHLLWSTKISRRFPTLLAHGWAHHFQVRVPCEA